MTREAYKELDDLSHAALYKKAEHLIAQRTALKAIVDLKQARSILDADHHGLGHIN